MKQEIFDTGHVSDADEVEFFERRARIAADEKRLKELNNLIEDFEGAD